MATRNGKNFRSRYMNAQRDEILDKIIQELNDLDDRLSP